MKWFGESWGAPACQPQDHTETPVGKLCGHCEEMVHQGDCGFLQTAVMSGHNTHEVAFHLECHMRLILGSVGHLNKRCSCYGGTDEDPPGMTVREAAIAAFQQYQVDGVH